MIEGDNTKTTDQPMRWPGIALVVFLSISTGGAFVFFGAISYLPARLLAIGLVLLCALNYTVSHDLLYPGCIFSFTWLAAVIVYLFFPSEIDPLAWNTVGIFLGGTTSLTFGCFLGARSVTKRRAWFTDVAGSPVCRNALLIYCALMIPFSALTMMKLAGVYSFSGAMFVAARQAVIDLQTDGQGASSNVLLSIAPTISVSTALLLLLEEKRRWVRAAGIVVTSILGLLTTGRIILMLLFCGWAILSLLRMPNRTINSVARRIVVIGVVIVVAISLPPLLTKFETQQAAEADQSSLAVTAQLTAIYIAGPLAGFNNIVETPGLLRDQPNNTFATVLTPLRLIGLDYTPPSHFEPFLSVPFPMNVFTAYKAFYVDFGEIGCLLAFFVIGAVSGSLFSASVRGNAFAQFAFCYIGCALILSPFQNSFIFFTRYLYVAIFGIMYFIVVPQLGRFTISLPGAHRNEQRCE